MERKRRTARNFAVVGVLLIIAVALLVVATRGRDVPVDVGDALEADGDPSSEAGGRSSETDESEPVTSSTAPGWLADIDLPEWLAVMEAEPSDGDGSDDSPSTLDEGSFNAVVEPGESIQHVVDELSEGSSILIKAGTHLAQQVKPKSGMTFVGEEGAVLDGQGITKYAFLAWEENEIDDVTIRGLEIKNYVPIPAMAAITSHRSGWVVEDCEVHHSSASGIRVHDNGVIRNCVVHNNERLGLKPAGDNILVEGNEVYSNNVNDLNDPTWEAGGIKGGGDGLTFRGNHVYDNHGPGIWLDVGAIHVLYENNLIENNTYSGINHEISYDAVIRNNTVRGNGHGDPRGAPRDAGIYVRGPNVIVYGNTLVDNGSGIILLENDRGDGEQGPYDLANIRVYGNLIVDSGENGAVRFAGSGDVFSTSEFNHNEYHYADVDAKWWHWNDSTLDWEGWLEEGNDQDGNLEEVQQ